MKRNPLIFRPTAIILCQKPERKRIQKPISKCYLMLYANGTQTTNVTNSLLKTKQ